LFVERDGKRLMANLNKNGYVYVYDRDEGKLDRVWKYSKTANWAERVDEKTGEIINRVVPLPGEEVNICPWLGGPRGWGAGSYNPNTGLWYTMAHEYCLTVIMAFSPGAP
jgi:alcohol dehydrogenase (cytochrome c)